MLPGSIPQNDEQGKKASPKEHEMKLLSSVVIALLFCRYGLV